MTNYKEKALYHLKRKTFANFWRLEEKNNLVFMYETNFDKIFKAFESWKEAYQFLYYFTRTTKRSWIDRIDEFTKKNSRIWDTDLEPLEQHCVDYMLEFFNYEQDSFELEELREILAENTDDENLVNTCEILINVLINHSKKIIEVE
tara:strand:- start:584 stop:1024 length:441 start_codon:yes stop_codon:yes gene_type:complete